MVKHRKIMEWYIQKKKSILQTTRRFESKFYERIINQQIYDIQDNKECSNQSRGTIGGQKYGITSRNTSRDPKNTSKTKYNI